MDGCALESVTDEDSPAIATLPSPAAEPHPKGRPFLTAAWTHLAMLNFRVDPQLLLPLVPRGTRLDLYEGDAIVTLVGFMFERARLFGIHIPWHQQFAEVNLRFYVRRNVNGHDRRGVVFIKEMVPRRMVAWTARYVFGERFARVPVACRCDTAAGGQHGAPHNIEYAWGKGAGAGRLSLTFDADHPKTPPADEAAFVIDRSWAYTVGRRGHWREYLVTHRPWRYWPATATQFDGDPAAWYGPELGTALRQTPLSAYLVDGSDVEVFRG